MLEPRLLLRDHRKLVFEPGPPRRRLRDLRESDIIAGGDEAGLKIPEESEDRGADPSIDFAYSDREGHWIAVEFKISTAGHLNFVRRGLAQVQHYSDTHSVQFDRAELWLLDKSSQVLSIWSSGKKEPLGSYGLANVMDTTPGARSDGRRHASLV